jgi:formylglycine-generating enzyme required for sulfatase activity
MRISRPLLGLSLAVAAALVIVPFVRSKPATNDGAGVPSVLATVDAQAGARKTGSDLHGSVGHTFEKTATIDLGGGVKMEFVLIAPGSFIMGASEETDPDGDATPAHRVVLTRPFYLGKYEVTQEQWEKVMGANPSNFKGAKMPVENISWNVARIFLAKLQEYAGRKFALPTEAQWEFACRAGMSAPWHFGDSESSMENYGWYDGDSGQTTHAVGSKKPNAWGLYDMHGNVAEWCEDWYDKHTYSGGIASDPSGPSSGSSRVLRGGAWGDNSGYLRSAYRNCNGPDGFNDSIGFRCVLLPEDRSP